MRFPRWLALTGASLFLVAACGAQATPTPSQSVSVYGVWGGDELDSFLAMVKPWEDRTGNKVQFTGTRSLNAVLTAGVASGILPDVAGIPGPGQMREWKDSLVDLSTVLEVEKYKSETSQAFVDLGTVDGRLVGVFIKSALKGPIWYNPKQYTAAGMAIPKTWGELDKIAGEVKAGGGTPWCVGLESGSASGWPGTDWIEDIVIRQSGPEVYDRWVAGEQKWTSPEIRSAFETFGEVVAQGTVYGGPNGVLTTNFGEAGNPLFTDPPGCYFHHQASFITGFFADQNPGIVAGQDYDFFMTPDIDPQYAGAVTGAGDLFGMFHDTPAARDLMKWLVSAEAQSIWVARGGALSGNKNVTNYPDEISKKSGQILAEAKIFRFDASDLMPEQMNAAFWKAMLDFTQDQSKLDEILQSLDTVQAEAYGG